MAEKKLVEETVVKANQSKGKFAKLEEENLQLKREVENGVHLASAVNAKDAEIIKLREELNTNKGIIEDLTRKKS